MGFRDAIFKGLNEAGNNIEQAYKFLDDASSRLDYRRYSETLLDILLAGGILGMYSNVNIFISSHIKGVKYFSKGLLCFQNLASATPRAIRIFTFHQ